MMMSYFQRSRKQRVVIAGTLMLLMLLTLQTLTVYPDWRDWTFLGLVTVGGVVTIGSAFVTSPIWGPALTGVGGVVILGGVGIGVWDVLDDSGEDAVCSNCGVRYERGTTHICIADVTETCTLCEETFVSGLPHSCPSPPDYTPNCSYCTAGCSACAVGSGGSSGSDYD